MNRQPTLSQDISNRLFVTILVAWVIFALLVVLSLVMFYRTDQSYSRALTQTADLQSGALNLNTAILSEMLSTRAYLISGKEESATQQQLAHQQTVRELNALQKRLSALPSIQTPSLDGLVELHEQYDQVAENLVALRRAGKITEATQLFDGTSAPLVNSITGASRDLQKEIQQGLLSSSRGYSQATEQWIWVVETFFLLGTGLSGLVLTRRVAPMLRQVDYFENALINAADTRVYHPLEGMPGVAKKPRLFDAYNHLIYHLLESKTAILKYVRHLHHESNSLLASIQGYGYMLADPKLRPEDATMEEYGRIIVQQTQRVTHLVEDFTLAVKIEGDQYTPDLRLVRLAPLLTAVVDEVSEEMHRAGTPANIQLNNADPSLQVTGDAFSLDNIFRSVIQNAIHYAPPGSPVLITVETCAQPPTILIHVRDQGVGIAPGDIHLLFRPFSRLKNEMTRRVPGSGLSLYLAASMLRVHRGSILVQSEPGKGSTFTIRLPLEEK